MWGKKKSANKLSPPQNPLSLSHTHKERRAERKTRRKKNRMREPPDQINNLIITTRTHKHKAVLLATHIIVALSRRMREPPDQINNLCSFTGKRFQKIMLLIVQYKCLKSCSKDFSLQNLILRTRLCGTGFITQPSCVFDFRLAEICQAEMICIGGVPVLKRHFGGAGPKIFAWFTAAVGTIKGGTITRDDIRWYP